MSGYSLNGEDVLERLNELVVYNSFFCSGIDIEESGDNHEHVRYDWVMGSSSYCGNYDFLGILMSCYIYEVIVVI